MFQRTSNGSNHANDVNQIKFKPAKHSSDSQPESQSSKCNPMHIVRLINIPWTATKSNIVDLFPGINIMNGKNGVHFIVDKDSKRNDAFVQLVSIKDYQLAMNHQGIHMGYSTVKS